MRFRNLSGKVIPKQLWFALAEPIGLGKVLPSAIKEPEMYGIYKTLRITLRPLKHYRRGEEITSGWYTYGHITLFPCRYCTIGSLTHLYLHELVHAWLHH
jgi:hypothetical protein